MALVQVAAEGADIPLAQPEILSWIRPGDRIFLDEGAIDLEASDWEEDRIFCVVRIRVDLVAQSMVHRRFGIVSRPSARCVR